MKNTFLMRSSLLWILPLCIVVTACDNTFNEKPVTKPAHECNVTAGLNRLSFSDGQLFYLYVPEKVLRHPDSAKILVSVHGYKGCGNDGAGQAVAESTALRWKDIADRQGWVVLAPHFDEDRFHHDYQTLRLEGPGRADERLHELIDETGRLLPGVMTSKMLLFGFSGGGQFVHRYALLHPERIDRAVAAGAGWYTFPDRTLPYPVGMDPESLPPGITLTLRDFFTVHLLVLVGADDSNEGTFRTAFRKGTDRYDLMALQGESRVERAKRWIASLRLLAGHSELNIGCHIVPHAGHRITKELHEAAATYLSGK